MHAFLEETAHSLIENFQDLSDALLILPSKRAGSFLKIHLLNKINSTQFAPRILSIEEFIEHVAELEIADPVELLFTSYNAYQKCEEISPKEDFDSFSSWAGTLLNDFNEIDRYLVPPKPFFEYMGSIKALERWKISEAETESMKAYLNFWENLLPLYDSFRSELLLSGKGYQGLVYRKAAEDIEHYIQAEGSKKHFFIGFNALNTAEQQIVRELLQEGNTHLYWDADSHFMNQLDHSASHFLRSYLMGWNWNVSDRPKGIAQNFSRIKEFTFVEAQKNIQQVKFAGYVLQHFSPEQLSQTAVVLADESLLMPLLNSLPENVQNVNVTMGIPLKGIPEVHFFELLMHLHLHKTNGHYYQDLLRVFQHPVAIGLLNDPEIICDQLIAGNYTYCTKETIYNLSSHHDVQALQLILDGWNEASSILKQSFHLIHLLRNSPKVDRFQRAALFKINDILKRIATLQESFPFLKTVSNFQKIFTELIATTSLDLQSDAHEGLQVMGVLETRCLDFKHLIFLSVNEGILPSGKQSNSFITYDLKHQFELPGPYEKDAIYAYHFYRLLHRVENAHFIYNVEADGLNAGERSRFLWQIEVEDLPQHTIQKKIVSLDSRMAVKTVEQIDKTDSVMNRIREIASRGFSPSALTAYIRNPLDFYYQRVLGIREFEEVEESVAAKTLGNIVHNSIELLYKPFEGKELVYQEFSVLRNEVEPVVQSTFEEYLKGGTLDKGKNVIVLAVAKRYVERLIEADLSLIKSGSTIKLLHVEVSVNCPLKIPGIPFDVHLRGQIDRVDELNGKIRIIDYKTGQVNPGELEILLWEDIISDYKHSKAFQVLTYAFMLEHGTKFLEAEAGVISFKNMSEGFIRFATKEKPRGGRKYPIINNEVLNNFNKQLLLLIQEICDPEVAFKEKKV